ncbi:MAG: BrnA antitoxin family protein [Gammaproteobacteria bacterium]|jgi:uncharacterized protein (DUF4415 family)|nr:BrnA antitoxin family protein [Gammaproteobacteria bacterium]
MSVKRRRSAPTSLESDDVPELDETWIAGADYYEGKKLVRRGRPRLEKPRKLLSLRLPPDVIESWKASGPGWQTRMADVLERAKPKSRRATG